ASGISPASAIPTAAFSPADLCSAVIQYRSVSLTKPARKRFSARFWMIEAVAGVAVGSAASAVRRASIITQAAPGITYPG
ncbi:hypothetical protein, partial [Cronobacter sakazakii]|uniref:hypothetical protein n=1 Tax=Cronobacter sakazakii TaxID=28141 RepID=UPI001177AFF9